ncbi:hypothetical protein FQN54_006205 [Arachnomyces sp. PD_36]|nr:hypothetical protein FQN54_006205 [Arachnomyces sp. PD_36]
MALLNSVRTWKSKFHEFRNAKRASEWGINHEEGRQEQNEEDRQKEEEPNQQEPKEADQEPTNEDDEDLRLPPGCTIADHFFLSSGWADDPDPYRHPGEAVNYIAYPRKAIDDSGNQRAYEQMVAIVGTKRIHERSRRKNPTALKEVFTWYVMLAEEEVPRVRAITEVKDPGHPLRHFDLGMKRAN